MLIQACQGRNQGNTLAHNSLKMPWNKPNQENQRFLFKKNLKILKEIIEEDIRRWKDSHVPRLKKLIV